MAVPAQDSRSSLGSLALSPWVHLLWSGVVGPGTGRWPSLCQARGSSFRSLPTLGALVALSLSRCSLEVLDNALQLVHDLHICEMG